MPQQDIFEEKHIQQELRTIDRQTYTSLQDGLNVKKYECDINIF